MLWLNCKELEAALGVLRRSTNPAAPAKFALLAQKYAEMVVDKASGVEIEEDFLTLPAPPVPKLKERTPKYTRSEPKVGYAAGAVFERRAVPETTRALGDVYGVGRRLSPATKTLAELRGVGDEYSKLATMFKPIGETYKMATELSRLGESTKLLGESRLASEYGKLEHAVMGSMHRPWELMGMEKAEYLEMRERREQRRAKWDVLGIPGR